MADGFDFDALVAEKRLAPLPIKLGGRTYQLRRDLTADERRTASLHFAQAGRDGDVEGLAILFGAAGEEGRYDIVDAEAFARFAAGLPHDVETQVWMKLLVAARLAEAPKTGGDDEDNDGGGDEAGAGESKAS